MDPENKYRLNVVAEDSLKYDCKFGGKNPTGMFDVIIGNPPFQEIKEEQQGAKGGRHNSGSLYIKFVKTYITRAPLLTFIIPSSKKDKIYGICDNKVTHWIDVAKERLGIDLPMCHFVYNESAASAKAGHLFDIDTTNNLGRIWSRPQIINRSDSRLGKGTIPIVDITGDKKISTPVTKTIEGVDVTRWPHYKLWKVITNTVGGYDNIGTLKIIGPGYITTKGVVSFGMSTEQEAKNLKNYMESKFVSYFIKKIKRVTPNAKHIFEKIPLVDLSRSWSDKEIYDYFGLTPEQIKEVDASTSV